MTLIPRKQRFLHLATTAAVLCLAIFFLIVAILVWDALRVGKAIDHYKGVPVRYNGLLFFRSHGKHYSSDGYCYGQKWQCVEYVKRFYKDAKSHEMPDGWGHAKDFFDPSLEDGMFNKRRGLIQYSNGSRTPPAPDDLLVFRDTHYGHAGIVTEVTQESVEIIQQNILGKPRQKVTIAQLQGGYYVENPTAAVGWLRKPQ